MIAANCPTDKPGRLMFLTTPAYGSYDSWVAGIAAFPPLKGWEVKLLADVDGTTDTDLKVFYGNSAATSQEYFEGVYTDYLAFLVVEPWGWHVGGLRESTGNNDPFTLPVPNADLIDGPTSFGEPSRWPPYGGGTHLLSANPSIAGFTAITAGAMLNSTSGGPVWLVGLDVAKALLNWKIQGTDIYGMVITQTDTVKGNTTFTGPSVTNDTWQYMTCGWSAAGGLVDSINTTHGAISSTTGTALDADANTSNGFGGNSDGYFTGYAFDMWLTNNILLSSDRIDTYYNNFNLGNTFFTVGAEQANDSNTSAMLMMF